MASRHGAMANRRSSFLALLAMLAVLGLAGGEVRAADVHAADPRWPPVSLENPRHFVPRDGATLYRIVCQACHMADARGAQGAGMYPALAQDLRLKAAAYPVHVVLTGQHAMPAFGSLLDDEQVAAVVDFVRSNFGNHYTDKTPVSLVKALRP
jgi:mono/diheme cytochrome c family protein